MTAVNMQGKVCLVTGCTSGRGKVTARELAKMGATLVMVCRNRTKGEAVQTEIKQMSNDAQVDLIVADLSQLTEVRRVANEFKLKYTQLHVLINNAGTMSSEYQSTVDGLENTFVTNYLSSFLLTQLLLETLAEIPENTSPLSRPPRELRSHYRWRAGSACTKCVVGTTTTAYHRG